MKVALYRHYDAEDALLYIGISLNPVHRLAGHMEKAKWAKDISRVQIEWFDTRDEASAAEARAISAEDPKHNGTLRRIPAKPAPGPAVRGKSQTTAQEWMRLAAEGLTPAEAAERAGKTPAAARKAAQIHGFQFRDGRSAERFVKPEATA